MSPDGESTPKQKEMEQLEFDAVPQVPGLENWKTEFWRELIPDSTRVRQVTECLSEIDQTPSTQELDDAGSGFGYLGSRIAKAFMEILSSDFRMLRSNISYPLWR